MRKIPEFPHYKMATPPVSSRWLATCAAIILMSGAIAAVLNKSAAGSGVVLMSMTGIAALCGLAWLLRVLYFRLSVHHACTWNDEVEREHARWWAIHQRQFALNAVVLIGPSGVELSDWLRVIEREHPAPPLRQEASGKARRIPAVFATDPGEREKQLAQMLVLQWKKQHGDAPAIYPEKFFWLGNLDAWSAFAAQLNHCFPKMQVPALPEKWQGAKTLALFADIFGDGDRPELYLIAGCHALSPSCDADRPAGECAVLWLAGCRGDVLLSRGEVFEPAEAESLRDVTLRAEMQSGLAASPDRCMLFSHPELAELAECGWNATHNIQDDYWGTPGELEALVVISLAAISAKSEANPCGWIASDPQCPLALGVVKPYGK